VSLAAPVTILAESRADLLSALLPWLAALLGIVILGSVIAMLVRRWMNPSGSGNGSAMTLEDLRRLHRDGALSDEEFDAAKTALLATFKPAKERKTKPESGSPRASGREPEQP